MPWVVDTCVVIDVLENDPQHGLNSAQMLEGLRSDGLLVCPVTMVELAPVFSGDIAEQRHFLALAGIAFDVNWEVADTEAAHAAWNRHVTARRRRSVRRRPVADILIGAFAERFEGLVTRNPKDFSPWFPSLPVRVP